MNNLNYIFLLLLIIGAISGGAESLKRIANRQNDKIRELEKKVELVANLAILNDKQINLLTNKGEPK